MVTEPQKDAYNYFLGNGFIPVDATTHSIVKNCNDDNLIYDMTACLTVIWAKEYNTLYKVINGFFCSINFYLDNTVTFCLHRPLAAHDLQCIVDILYDISIKAGFSSLLLEAVEERFLDDYRSLKSYRLETGFIKNMSEYIYSPDSILNLEGRANKEKRRLLKKFLDKPNIFLKDLTKENVNQCLEIEKEWCRLKDCTVCKSFTGGCSKKTMEIMTDIFDGTVYRGVLGYIDDILTSYLIFEKLNDDYAYFHLAKTTTPNFSLYVYYTAVQRFMSKVKRINLGADLGIQGLKLFKQGLGAHDLQKKYLCTFTKEGRYEKN